MGARIVVRDLKDELIVAAGLPIKAKTAWVRRITGVDPAKRDTFAFTGPGFLADGTIQVTLGVPRLYLVGGDDGGRYATKHYRFVEMDPSGTLVPTPIQETDRKAGWALRVRDQVQAILDVHAAYVAANPTQAATPLSNSGATPPAAPVVPPIPAPVTAAPVPPPAPTDTPPAVDDDIRPILVALVGRHGAQIVDDPRRLVALLNDACGGRFGLEQRLLTMALSCGVVDEMRKPSIVPTALQDAHLAARLMAHWGVYQALAAWTVQTWREVI